MLCVQCTAVLRAGSVFTVYTSSDYSQQKYSPDSFSQMEISSIRYAFNSFCCNFLVWGRCQFRSWCPVTPWGPCSVHWILSVSVCGTGSDSLLLPAITNTACYWPPQPDVTVLASHWSGHSRPGSDWLGVVITLMTSLGLGN